jgi:hypothetical protein
VLRRTGAIASNNTPTTWRVVPQTQGTQFRSTKNTGSHSTQGRIKHVGTNQRPAGGRAQARAKSGSNESVNRPSVIEMLAQADKRVGDEKNADGCDEEGKRDCPANVDGAALGTDVCRHRRSHQS